MSLALYVSLFNVFMGGAYFGLTLARAVKGDVSGWWFFCAFAITSIGVTGVLGEVA